MCQDLWTLTICENIYHDFLLSIVFYIHDFLKELFQHSFNQIFHRSDCNLHFDMFIEYLLLIFVAYFCNCTTKTNFSSLKVKTVISDFLISSIVKSVISSNSFSFDYFSFLNLATNVTLEINSELHVMHGLFSSWTISIALRKALLLLLSILSHSQMILFSVSILLDHPTLIYFIWFRFRSLLSFLSKLDIELSLWLKGSHCQWNVCLP